MTKIFTATNHLLSTIAVAAEAGETYMAMVNDDLIVRAEHRATIASQVAAERATESLLAATQARVDQELLTMQALARLAAYIAEPTATVSEPATSTNNARASANDYSDVVFNDDGTID